MYVCMFILSTLHPPRRPPATIVVCLFRAAYVGGVDMTKGRKSRPGKYVRRDTHTYIHTLLLLEAMTILS